MFRSILIGITAGARSMTPLAVVANAARTGTLPADNGAPKFLAHPLASLGATALASYELVGDKQKSAPDRIIPAAVIIRSLNAAFAGMALAPRNQRFSAAALAGASAVIASYVTYAARMHAMRSHSQFATGAIEDVITVSGALAAAHAPLPEVLKRHDGPAVRVEG